MMATQWYPNDVSRPALILDSPHHGGGLWNPDMSELMESLSEELDVFVTCAGSGRGSMRLRDALAAARFMGCESAVIVSPSDNDGERARRGHALQQRGRPMPVVFANAAGTVTGMVEAYRDACRFDWAAA